MVQELEAFLDRLPRKGGQEHNNILIRITGDLLKNVNRVGVAKRWATETLNMFCVVAIRGGPAEFLSLQLNGPSATTIRRHRQ
jgi:hypothetical protein